MTVSGVLAVNVVRDIRVKSWLQLDGAPKGGAIRVPAGNARLYNLKYLVVVSRQLAVS